MKHKPRGMSVEKYEEYKLKMQHDINFLFVVQEVFGHAFTDFYASARNLNLDVHEFKRVHKQIDSSLSWFSNWYSGAFKGEESLKEKLGESGDIFHKKLKEEFINN